MYYLRAEVQAGPGLAAQGVRPAAPLQRALVII